MTVPVLSLTLPILRILGDGEFHSGTALAQHFQVSRATVWQALQNLEEAGVELFAVRGRGYRLAYPLSWVQVNVITELLNPKANFLNLELVDVTTSTNTLLTHKAALGAPHGSCLITEYQTEGRGRRGRSWHSGLGGALTFSLLWRFEQGAASLSGLSLAVGVAILRALKTMGVQRLTLKWPNDVLSDYHKLAGTLVEIQGDISGPCAAIIGVGINYRLHQKTRALIDQAVTDLDSLIHPLPEKNRALAELLNAMVEVMTEFEHSGFAGLREEWLRYHAPFQNKWVSLALAGNRTKEGRILDVADDGALILQTMTSLERHSAGEISLRRAEK